jgi:basic membrane lipoprotein Med (substrate-binding protein (PBP1-ABC) superfamily)
MLKTMVVAVAAAALIAAGAAQADTQSLAQTVVACVYNAGHCQTSALNLAAGESVTLTKQQLADACKNGGYATVGTSNQGQCVSFVERVLGSGVTVTGAANTGPDPGLRSDGNGGLIANIYSDGNGGLIANLYSDGNGGLIAN